MEQKNNKAEKIDEALRDNASCAYWSDTKTMKAVEQKINKDRTGQNVWQQCLSANGRSDYKSKLF